MAFSRSTFDVAIGASGRFVAIYEVSRALSLGVVLDRLGVVQGAGGGVVSIRRAPLSGAYCFPTGVLLVEDSTTSAGYRVVGLLPEGFEQGCPFLGICTDEGDLVERARWVGRYKLTVGYGNSSDLFLL